MAANSQAMGLLSYRKGLPLHDRCDERRVASTAERAKYDIVLIGQSVDGVVGEVAGNDSVVGYQARCPHFLAILRLMIGISWSDINARSSACSMSVAIHDMDMVMIYPSVRLPVPTTQGLICVLEETGIIVGRLLCGLGSPTSDETDTAAPTYPV